MACYNEIFVEENGQLKHIGSCTGSDTPCFFQKVKSLTDWNDALANLEEENGFYPHNEKHPFPWKTYKTSDELIVLRKNPKIWWKPWSNKYEVWISVDKYGIDDEHKSYFVKADRWVGDDYYEDSCKIILEFPKLK